MYHGGYTQGVTLLGSEGHNEACYSLFPHPERHPGGLFPVYTQGGTLVGIPGLYPERHPGGCYSLFYVQMRHLVGVILLFWVVLRRGIASQGGF